jgi:hypothetical protein
LVSILTCVWFGHAGRVTDAAADEPGDARSPADVLRDAYAEVVELDEHVHAVRRHLRAQLHALGVPTDPVVAERIRDVEASGIDDAVAAETFVDRLRARLADK